MTYMSENQREEAQVLHWCCGHPFLGDALDPKVRKEKLYDPRDYAFSRRGWTITQPRWCAECTDQRAREIYASYEFLPQSYRGEHREDDVAQLAWNLGIRQGRIEGLSMDTRPPDQEAPPRPDPKVAELQKLLGGTHLDPIATVLREMSTMSVVDTTETDVDRKMDTVSELMGHTDLAPNPYTNPFTFPVAASIRPPELNDPIPNDWAIPQMFFGPRGERKSMANYSALWHPRTRGGHGEVDETTDRLLNFWAAYTLSIDPESRVTKRNVWSAVYVAARNRGALYQMALEREVLWEPEGLFRSEALDRTTEKIPVIEDTQEEDHSYPSRNEMDVDSPKRKRKHSRGSNSTDGSPRIKKKPRRS